MRLKLTKKIFLFFVAVGVASLQTVRAQDFTEIFKAPEEDVVTYLNRYIEPGMLSFANGMAGGWYNTAKPHKPLGFDLTVSVNVANIPTSERLFAFSSSDFQALSLEGGGSADLPTLVGGDTDERLILTAGTSVQDQFGNTFEYTKTSTSTYLRDLMWKIFQLLVHLYQWFSLVLA